MEEEHSHVNDSAFTPMKFEFGASTTDNPYFIDGITGQNSAVMDTDWFYDQQITRDYDEYLGEYEGHQLQNQVLYSNLRAEPSNMIEDPSTYMACLQQVPQSYVGFLSESGASEIQNQMEWNHPVEAPSFMLDYPSSYEEGHKQMTYQRQHDAAGEVETLVRLLNQKDIQEVTPATRYPSRARSESSKQRARENERIRKSKVTKNLKALQDLVPHSMEDGKGRSMDHIIDYIKYLQFQVKDLSRTSFGEESASTHFSSVQDHVTFLMPKCNIILSEEMMGKLLEDDSPWAMQLMQSRGLSLMPISLAVKLS